MIRRSPAEYYIKYLVVHPDQYTDDYILDTCSAKQLDCPEQDYLEGLRAKLSPPKPFYPFDRLHVKSQRFLFKEKLQQLFLPDVDMQAALRLLGHARAKEFVETMILSGAPTELIAGALGPHRKFYCTDKAVKLYVHYFWNTDLVDSTELRTLLQLRVPEEGKTESEKKASKAFTKAYREDPRVVAAALPSSPLFAMMSQMRMGLMPKNMDLGDAIEAARRMATLRTLEAITMGGPFDSKRALDFSLVAKHMTDMLETVVRPDEKMRQELATIALRTEEGPVPYIHELSSGEHTVELTVNGPETIEREDP